MWTKIKFITLIVLVLLFGLHAYIFYSDGSGGYQVTLIFYCLIIISIITLIKKKVISVNLLVITLFLFITETYLRTSKDGPVNYTEKNSNSIFGKYYSVCYSDKKNVDGLFVHKPNSSFAADNIEYQYTHTYNEEGLREKPLSSFANNKNILLLGDSFTEGVGAPADSTISISLKKYLDSLDYNYEVINGGVSGSDIFFCYKLMEYLAPKVKPELVILNINSSDATDINVRGGNERFVGKKFKYKIQRWWEFFYSFSYIFREISHHVFNAYPYKYNNEENIPFVVNQIAEKINDFSNYCDKHNIKFVLVNIPNSMEIQNNEFIFDYILSNSKLKKGIKYVYLKKGIIEEIGKEGNNIWKFYYPIDTHLTPEANWFWGFRVANAINYMKLLDIEK